MTIPVKDPIAVANNNDFIPSFKTTSINIEKIKFIIALHADAITYALLAFNPRAEYCHNDKNENEIVIIYTPKIKLSIPQIIKYSIIINVIKVNTIKASIYAVDSIEFLSEVLLSKRDFNTPSHIDIKIIGATKLAKVFIKS
jgi:hypothetical protein